MTTNRITKTLYIRGLQCLKSLWLEKHNKALKVVSERIQSLFDGGKLVGDTALGLFPGGVMIPYIGGKGGQDKQLQLTQEAIESGASVIYEAAFHHNGKFSKVDILVRDAAGFWNIYEVKSGTSVDQVYLEDVAFQYHLIKSTGIPLKSAFLAYINNKYVRQGELDLKHLFNIQDVTEFAEGREEFVLTEHTRQLAVLAGDMPKCDIGKHCDDPYECEYKAHCWAHIPKDSVFDIKGAGIDKISLYKQGIIKQSDIPAEILAVMNAKQRQQVECTKQKMGHIDSPAVKAFLETLTYPLSMFDVETFTTPIPLYDGLKPYQQTAFQYSLHILQKGGEVEHYEFLAEPGVDPRPAFIESLVSHMPVNGTVVAYNKSFETAVLQGLAKGFPQFEDYVTKWVSTMADLMVPFRQRTVYRWDMRGSYSIKYVLPSLCAELNYGELSIANGQAAMDAYHTMSKLKNDPEKLAAIRADLLKYCCLDTYAMIKIFEFLDCLPCDGGSSSHRTSAPGSI